MAAKVASTKGRQVLGDLGTNVGYGGTKKGMVEQKHENNGMVSPKIGRAPARPEAEVVNPRSDLEVREYLDSVHVHFLETETTVMPPTDYMNHQPELTADMRAVCLDWIVECANRFKMAPETLFLTVNVLDRFLAVKPIQRKRMQLATMVSLVIASKYEEIYPPRIKEFIHISADAFSREDMIRYEHNILHALKYTLTVPTPFGFLSRYLLELRPEGVPETEQDKKLKYATHFIAECAFYNLELYLQHLPSFLAAAAVHAGRVLCKEADVWPQCLTDICEYSLSEIETLSRTLIKHAKSIKNGNLEATTKTYSSERKLSVADLL